MYKTWRHITYAANHVVRWQKLFQKHTAICKCRCSIILFILYKLRHCQLATVAIMVALDAVMTALSASGCVGCWMKMKEKKKNTSCSCHIVLCLLGLDSVTMRSDIKIRFYNINLQTHPVTQSLKLVVNGNHDEQFVIHIIKTSTEALTQQ